MKKTFEYQKDFQMLAEACPPEYFTYQNIDPVFRWVFDALSDKNNFISQYHRKPKRFLEKNNDIKKCKAMGLSFFDNFEGSLKRYSDLQNQIGDKIYETLGTKIAQGYLTEEDGVNGDFDLTGHFTHHPYSTKEYFDRFNLIYSFQ